MAVAEDDGEDALFLWVAGVCGEEDLSLRFCDMHTHKDGNLTHAAVETYTVRPCLNLTSALDTSDIPRVSCYRPGLD